MPCWVQMAQRYAFGYPQFFIYPPHSLSLMRLCLHHWSWIGRCLISNWFGNISVTFSRDLEYSVTGIVNGDAGTIFLNTYIDSRSALVARSFEERLERWNFPWNNTKFSRTHSAFFCVYCATAVLVWSYFRVQYLFSLLIPCTTLARLFINCGPCSQWGQRHTIIIKCTI